jgi:hypothetical protein
MTGRRRPFVREAAGDLAGGGLATEVDRQKDLPARGVSQSGYHGVEGRQFLGRVLRQSCSTSQIVSSSKTGPIGSQTAMTSGV